MAISDKLTYLNETKSQLKDMINYGLPSEQQITSSTTFRNYVSSIFNAFLEALRTPDTLFTNLPKKSGTGAVISLNDTANAPMRIELGASELSQDATPTPSSPQDIHTISGSNKVVVNGKNLWSVGDIANVGWATSNNDFKDLLNSLEAGTYTLTLNYKVTNINLVSNTNICGFYIANSNSSISKRKTETSLTVDEIISYVNTISITSAMVGKFTAVYFYGFGNDSNGKTATSDIINNQLEKNTQATTYEPYISQEADIDLPTGENIFNHNTITSIGSSGAGTTNTYSNDIIHVYNFTQTGSSNTVINYSALSLPAGKYYISLDARGTNGTFGKINDGSVNWDMEQAPTLSNEYQRYVYSYTYTSTKSLGRILVQFGVSDTNAEFDIKNIMISKADIPYEPYGSTPIEYCKIGNYEDKFIRTSGKNLIDAVYYNANNYVSQKLTLKAGTYITSYTGDNSSAIYIRKADGTTPINGTSVAEGYNRISFSFTLTNDGDYYIQFYLGGGGFTNFRNAILNTGTTALPYEPYGSNEWYIKKNIGKVVLDGTEEGWAYNSTNKNFNIRSYYLGMVSSTSGTGYIPKICNYFKYYASNGNTPNLADGIYENTNSTQISFLLFHCDSLNITTLEAWKTWLGANKPVIYYKLETSTYTQITGTLANQLENIYQKLLSYTGTTNISQVNNDLPFVLDVEAVEEI